MPCPDDFAEVNPIAQYRFHGFEQRLRLQHHAFAPAEGAIIDGAMPVMRERSQVVHTHIRNAGLACARRTIP